MFEIHVDPLTGENERALEMAGAAPARLRRPARGPAALRPARRLGTHRPQRPLPLRLGQEVQALPRGAGVTPDVLTPRPDTETILDAVLPDFSEHQRFSVLDLGVGSGAILLAILAERPRAIGLGVDVSEEALAVARENAANLGLAARTALLRGDWAAGLAAESFDLVVANPPYIPSDEISGLAPEVRDHEPRVALDGGADGLDAFRVLAPQILRVLRGGGRFAVEIGIGQRAAVETLFEAAGARDLRAIKDLAGRERVVAGSKKPLGQLAASA